MNLSGRHTSGDFMPTPEKCSQVFVDTLLRASVVDIKQGARVERAVFLSSKTCL